MRSSALEAGTVPGRVIGLSDQSHRHNEGGGCEVDAGRDIDAKTFNAPIEGP
jgi:hypothetical protein